MKVRRGLFAFCGYLLHFRTFSTENSDTLNFFYDGEGRPAYFTYNNTTYYYVTNLQGDVIAILDSTGTVVVNYHYDAYGVLLQTGGTMAATLGTLNPLTYRGYVYDHDTGLYYLQSRYYNPTIRQFISADAVETLNANYENVNQYNMFAYCFNNPVNMYDAAGTWPNWIKKAATVFVVAAAVVTATVVTVTTFGAGSIAGVAMITASATLAARTTEVAALQIKKGREEGKSGGQIFKDTVESIYDNGSKIVGTTPLTKSAGIALNHILFSIIEKDFGGKQTLSMTLKAPGGKLFAYGLAAVAWVNTISSIINNNPLTRANERGYVLK